MTTDVHAAPRPSGSRRSSRYRAVWRRHSPCLPPGVWPDSVVSTPEAASILGCSIRTLERHREASTGPEHEPTDFYLGPAVWYRVWRLLAWRNLAAGAGPIDRDGIWAEWLTGFPGGGRRLDPPIRPNWMERGEPTRMAKRREARRIKSEFYRIGYELEKLRHGRLLEALRLQSHRTRS
jgi:hypothetical protein